MGFSGWVVGRAFPPVPTQTAASASPDALTTLSLITLSHYHSTQQQHSHSSASRVPRQGNRHRQPAGNIVDNLPPVNSEPWLQQSSTVSATQGESSSRMSTAPRPTACITRKSHTRSLALALCLGHCRPFVRLVFAANKTCLDLGWNRPAAAAQRALPNTSPPNQSNTTTIDPSTRLAAPGLFLYKWTRSSTFQCGCRLTDAARRTMFVLPAALAVPNPCATASLQPAVTLSSGTGQCLLPFFSIVPGVWSFRPRP